VRLLRFFRIDRICNKARNDKNEGEKFEDRSRDWSERESFKNSYLEKERDDYV
jgi:hypothetical protein